MLASLGGRGWDKEAEWKVKDATTQIIYREEPVTLPSCPNILDYGQRSVIKTSVRYIAHLAFRHDMLDGRPC